MSRTRTRIITVRCTVTYYTRPGAPDVLLNHQQSLACSLSNTPYESHEVTLVDVPFTARTVQAADDLAWAYRRSAEFTQAITAAAEKLGIPDPVLRTNRDFYFYDVRNVLTQ